MHMLGDNIRAAREARGLKQAELGRLLGVSPLRMWRYESGRTQVDVEMLTAIAAALGVTTDSLIGIEAAPAPAPADLEPHVEYDDAPRSTMLPPRLPTIPLERLSTIPPPATRRPSSRPPPSRPSEPPSPEGPLFIEGTNVADELDEFGQALGEVFGDPTEDE